MNVRNRNCIQRALAAALALAALMAAPMAAVGAQEGRTADVPPVAIDPETLPRPTGNATLTSERIAVDGRLDEAIWSSADSLDGFIQSQPDAGRPATERTVVRIVYDDRYLYVGARVYESDPGAMVISTLEKDFPGESTRDYDILGLTLDTFHDRKNSFIYLINPMGAVRDGQTYDDSRETNFSWDGVHEVRTRIEDWGWSLEMAIPWTSLRFDPTVSDQQWGLNILRRVRRKNEDSHWAPLDRRDPVHKMSKAGTLNGLRAIPASRNLMITPYVSAASESGVLTAPGDRGGQANAGLDLKYGLTPKLTLDLTYNTDFSQVEVDEEKVNLTRFSLFFPEKRDFFVENSGVFTFGDVTERGYRMGSQLSDFTLFHSRRIGLEEGRPVPIVGGGRMSGRVGDYEVGLLNMRTASAGGEPGENFAVARVRRQLAGIDVGALVVNRQSTGGGNAYNRSWGVDATARVWNNLIVNSYVAGTDSPGDTPGGELASRLSAGWRDQLWDISAMYKLVGEGFDPGVGYVRRTGMRQSYATVGAHPRPDIPLVQTLNPYLEFDYITSPTNLLETRSTTAGLQVTFNDGSTLESMLLDRFERLDESFSVSGGASVPTGSYAFREGRISYNSSKGRPLSANVSLSGGGFFDGDRRSIGLGATWRANYRMSVELRADHNEIRIPDGEFTAALYGARLRYAHSTRLFGSAFVQYNDALDQLVTNLRANLIHAPLSDLFLVYTDRRDLGGEVQERLLTVKLTRMIAF